MLALVTVWIQDSTYKIILVFLLKPKKPKLLGNIDEDGFKNYYEDNVTKMWKQLLSINNNSQRSKSIIYMVYPHLDK